MKLLIGVILGGMLVGCTLTENGVIIDTPSVPSINVCEHVATNADVTGMKTQIEAQSFKDERMERAKVVTKGYCFVSAQVVDIMGSFTFADAQLEIAKLLYHQTTDKDNYYQVVDTLTHKSDRDELKAYIAAN